MFTEEELYSLLEEAFEAGYDSAIDELEEAMTESEFEEFDTEYPELFDEAHSIGKHPDRIFISKAARAAEKEYGVPRETTYRMAQKSAQGVQNALSRGMSMTKAAKYGMKQAAKDWYNRTSVHDRINQRAGNDKVFGVGKGRKNRIDATADEIEKYSGGEKIDRKKLDSILRRAGVKKSTYNG